MDNCIFCKIIAGQIPVKPIWEDENVIAINDINPQAPVHVLIIPRKHIVTFDQFTEGDAAIMVSMAKAVKAVAADKNVLESGYRLMVNNGPDGHQEVLHLHMHLFAGRKLGHMIMRPKEG